ncbi:hypothetical protein [Nonomuraea sp. C10]|uniref:hypothetical protein n=1 Tax=Nonomuraea sp. C10 TaxID=2600577 RepID=UPI0011CDB8FA|nr:hypothetical protein [Nonomuraea sp. C10]TXK40168.1 hypothetical protein FR742_11695 [Nonomuraea sp. C10]
MRFRPSPPMAVVLLLVAALALSWTLPGIGPALRLATGHGLRGTFTAQRLDCLRHPGHESCAWTGAFRSRDGLVQRTEVTLAGSDRGTHRAGQRVEAVDVGLTNRVYGPGGSAEWVFTVLLALAELALLAFALMAIAGAVRRGEGTRSAAGASRSAPAECGGDVGQDR